MKRSIRNIPLMALVLLIVLTILFVSCGCGTSTGEKCTEDTVFKAQDLFPEPPRPEGQKDVIELACEPIDTVRIGFIGLGMRGSGSVYRYTFIENVEIKAICDVVPENVEKTQKLLKEKGLPKADEYTGAEDWKKICERDDIDLIYVCTHWDLHTPIAVYAMEHGKHVAVEVPGALTIDECWQLVNTAERTRKHCMQLENCNYDFFEIATLNMAQQGLFGEIVHCEGAYIHDLRFLNFDEKAYWNMWRLKHLEKSDGNTYPTHGFGPICHIMNIHRGDKMNHIVSMSTNQFGMTAYAKEKFGEDSDYAKRAYKKGDMNTSLIRTEKGKTIMLQHDVTSPRPYSRLHTVSGTKGFAQKYPQKGIALEPDAHQFLPQDKLDALLKEYAHPIVKDIEEKAKAVGGHGGMDFIMDYRLIYCLRNGLPLDQDVYDAAEWSSIIELSRKSVENQSMPIRIPDFTRGAWKKVNTVTYFKK
jgi:predicted dehydrogenase